MTVEARGDTRPDAISTDQRDTAFVENLSAAFGNNTDAFDVGGEVLDPNTEFERHIEFFLCDISQR